MKRFLTILIIMFISFANSFADKVYLKNGKMLEGEVIDEGGAHIFVEVRVGNSTARLKKNRDEIERIEKASTSTDLFPKRFKESQNDLKKLLELAQWCEKENLKDERAKVIETLKTLAPENPEVQQLLYEFEKKDKTFEQDDAREQEILAHLGSRFRVLRSQHYLIFYSSPLSFAKRRKAQFENLYDKFYSYWEKKEFQLKTLDQRLVSILFESREEFQIYAKNNGGLPQAGGYYWSKTNWTYFYDSGVSANIAKAEAQIEERKKQIKEFEEKIKQPNFNLPQNKKTLTEMKKNLRKYEDYLENFVEDQNLTITIHEATHQLCYNLGIIGLSDLCPTWVTEGIAVYFETGTEDGSWQGPGRKNDSYIQEVKGASSQNKLPAFTQFLAINQGFFSGGIDTGTGYALSWTLMYFLLRDKAYEPKLNAYIKALFKADARKMYRSEEILKFIETHLGPLPQLEADWNAEMRRLGALAPK
jgi:hypothetical protein